MGATRKGTKTKAGNGAYAERKAKYLALLAERAEGTIGDGQSHAADAAQTPQPDTDHIGPKSTRASQ